MSGIVSTPVRASRDQRSTYDRKSPINRRPDSSSSRASSSYSILNSSRPGTASTVIASNKPGISSTRPGTASTRPGTASTRPGTASTVGTLSRQGSRPSSAKSPTKKRQQKYNPLSPLSLAYGAQGTVSPKRHLPHLGESISLPSSPIQQSITDKKAQGALLFCNSVIGMGCVDPTLRPGSVQALLAGRRSDKYARQKLPKVAPIWYIGT